MARVGHERAQPAPKPEASRDRLATFAARLSEPRAILVIIPALIASVGLFLTLVAEVALRESSRAIASERLGERNRVALSWLETALMAADPMLDRLTPLARAHEPDAPFEDVARTLVDLAAERPGVTYVSISFTDGTFEGAYLDEDGRWRFQVSRLTEDRTLVRRFDVDAVGLTPYREERSDYDPRTRDFYRRAMEHRAWSEPYPFFGSRRTGITRAAPVMRDGALHAVLTVDFDVDALSSYLRSRSVEGSHSFLYADDAILAYSEDAGAASDRAASEGRTLRASDLGEPALDAFFASSLATEAEPEARDLDKLDVDGEVWLVSTAALPRELGLSWRIATLAPRASFLGTVRAYEVKSVLVALFAVLVAAAIAYFFARHVTRVREEAKSARADAEAAEARADQLGSYRLVALLGKGAMGEVWRAEHTLLARDAAIKLVAPPREGVISDEARARFRREAEALARLKSRHTIEIFDFGVSGEGRFFLVMELLEGLDLEKLVEVHGPQPAARVIRILRQACRSLAEAHDEGLVHRDIKPANLFLCRCADEVDVVKVLDFGVVRVAAQIDVVEEPSAEPSEPRGSDDGRASHLTETSGGITGTPAFMPPEQAQALDVDGRADLYALAGVAVWLLTGKLVFDHPQPMALLLAHLTEPVPDLRASIPDAPAALVELLTACLSKSPEDRPASARAMLEALSAMDASAFSDADALAWWKQHVPEVRTSVRPSARPSKAPSSPSMKVA